MPFKYIIAVSTGQAIAGIMLNVIEYILLAIMGDVDLTPSQHKTKAFIFFSFAALIVFINILFLFVINY